VGNEVPVKRGEGTGVASGEEDGKAVELLAPFLGANKPEQEPMIRKRTIKDRQPPMPPPWPAFVFTARF
jgi:hypothetical protein